MTNKKNNRIYFVTTIAVLFICITTSFSLGYLAGTNRIGLSSLVKNVVNKNTGKSANTDFSLFWDAWDKLTENYNGELDSDKMLQGAISGMISTIGDPYTMYLTPEQMKLLDEELQGSFEGIGIEIGLRDNQILIIAPIDDTPAKKADLRANDKILEIDSKSTEGMTMDQAVSMIKGAKNTEVNLKILRGEETLQKTILRDTIVIKSVKAEIKNDYGYLKINTFGEDTANEVKNALEDFKSKNVKGYIVDVRGNPGGYLDSAVDIASYFIDSGIVLWEKEKQKEKAVNTTNKKIVDKPIMVLIDKGSASASEIFAGALRDRARITLVGEKSFGKGSVQSIESLKSGSLKITIAQWLTPDKTVINNVGLTPDINVEFTEEDYKANKDPQLERALEEIVKK